MNQPGLEEAILLTLEEAERPASISYVTRMLSERRRLKKNWSTIRALLLQLMAQGKIHGTEVAPRGWIFWVKERPLEVPVRA